MEDKEVYKLVRAIYGQHLIEYVNRQETYKLEKQLKDYPPELVEEAQRRLYFELIQPRPVQAKPSTPTVLTWWVYAAGVLVLIISLIVIL